MTPNRRLNNRHDEAISPETAILLKEWIAQQESELAKVGDEVRNEQAQRVSAEKNLIKLQEQLKYLQALSDFQRIDFAQDMVEKEALIKNLDKDLLVQRTETVDQRNKLAEMTLACQTDKELLALQDKRLIQLEQTVATSESKLKTSEEALQKVRGETAEVRVKLHEANLKYRTVTEQAAETHAKLNETNLKYRNVTEQYALIKEQIAQGESMLDQQRLLLDQIVTEKENQLKTATAQCIENKRIIAELTQDKNRLSAESRALAEQIKQHALQLKKTKTDHHAQIERLRQQKLAAENQVAKTRATISFQLGYLLTHGFKTFKAFQALLGQLLALRQESRRRKAEKKDETLFSIFIAPSGGTLPPAVIVQADLHSAPGPIATAVPTLPTFSDFSAALKRLKIASIMDEFTGSSFLPECNLLQLTPQHWQQELDRFAPELLFIESAWRGKDELWGNKVGHSSAELVGIVEWCHQRQVPTVFWNKEDPVHFETFLNTAKLFDYVFTTDIDCIHRYKGALGHDRVYLLPFACQPQTTNPLETYERKDAFCFAGAYYVRYPERTRDLGNFVSALAALRPVEIYDRNYGKNDPNYQFPPEYQPFIVGNLPFDQIDRAYKGYCYAINLNSIKQSQSMFARRAFDLLASNTVTVSNYSRGVRLFFGDLMVTTDDGDEAVRRLEALGTDDVALRKFRLAGLRKVMQEHTYQDRLAYVVSKAQGSTLPSLLPDIVVTAYAESQQQLDALLASFIRQSYAHKRLLAVIATGFTPVRIPNNAAIQILAADILGAARISGLLGACEYVAGMVADDYYGPNYLMDLALASRYSRAGVIGKVTHHLWSDDSGLTIAAANQQYRLATGVAARAALARTSLVDELLLRDWITTLQTRQIEAAEVLGIDEFNYCKNGNRPEFLSAGTGAVNDLAILDTGIAMDELIRRAEQISAAETAPDEAPMLTGAMLATYFKPPAGKGYQLTVSDCAWEVESTLADGKHDYLYAATYVSPAELGYTGHMQFHLDVTPGLGLQLAILFLDAQKQQISSVVKTANRNHETEIPVGTEWIRFGLRFYGSGSARINGLVLGHRPLRPAEVIGRTAHLVLTNHYPTYDDLYRNRFVHSRVAAYRVRGTRVDVFRLRSAEALTYHEFHDVDVITGSSEALHKLLLGGRYQSVLVHFLNEEMWQVLQQHIEHTRVLVWVHGAEIQPWHRRDFNNETEEQRDASKLQSEKRMTFWGGLLKKMPANLKLVFVSNYLAEAVMEDLGFRLPEEQYAVIHNPIDTEFFAYVEKTPEQRKKILSIRPYASRAYANDLSVQAILKLSKQPWFNDLEFRLIGDGRLFDATLAPLRPFRNVCIEQRFLNHTEIAALHRQHGIFLCPSRMDTQGVSRDEAMSSGLVPVTNRVTAIPEFVDGACAILADAEDAAGMAAGIADLYKHPEKFLTMSKAAGLRVRKQSSAEQMIRKELDLFSPATAVPIAITPLITFSSSPTEATAEQQSNEDTVHSFLSFDVEALPGRAQDNPFETLIWGRAGGEEFGIRRICKILRQYRVKGNFMVDLAAALLYGDAAVQQVVDYLLSEGHEVHTHLHSEWVIRNWGLEKSLGSNFFGSFNNLDYDLGRHLLDFSAWKYRQFTGRDATVFRPGGFLFNRQTLLAAKTAGFTASTAFNRERHHAIVPPDLSHSLTEPFMWDNGLIEVPVDLSPEPLTWPMEPYFGAFDRVEFKRNKTFNLVLHSWSLAKRDENGHHPVFTPAHQERLEQICSHIASVGKVSGYDEYLSRRRPLETAATDLCWAAPILKIAGEVVSCSICGALLAKKTLVGDICPGCSSRTRQRQLQDVIQTVGNPFDGKSVLACYADPTEKQAFLNKAKRVVNFDVRPVNDVDKQMDIQNMSDIADGSFDCFFAMHVLNHVRDDGRALAEIARVINADGMAVLCVPYREKESTTACEEITETYGATALEEYDVGNFRRYGMNDFIHLLEQFFTVSAHDGRDTLTGQTAKLFFAYSKKQAANFGKICE